jgi:hypothetical protein
LQISRLNSSINPNEGENEEQKYNYSNEESNSVKAKYENAEEKDFNSILFN